MSEQIFYILLYVWIGIAFLLFPLLLNMVVPYGRHSNKNWGPMINNKFGWIIMELPVILIFTALFFLGPVPKTWPILLLYGVFILHYINRIFIFPIQIKGRHKQMPMIIAISAMGFIFFNGFFNGYWFGYLSAGYDDSWFSDWRFVSGLILFVTGMVTNIVSDQKLIRLRSGGETGYYVPYGGLFNYISSPNLFGEILEWFGWALMCWCLPSLSFAIWTFANLVPRAINHHKWYKQNFENYPTDRKAVIPFII